MFLPDNKHLITRASRSVWENYLDQGFVHTPNAVRSIHTTQTRWAKLSYSWSLCPLHSPLNNETPGFERQRLHHFLHLIIRAHPFPVLPKLLFARLLSLIFLEKHLHREARFDRQLHRSRWRNGTCKNAAG